MAAVDEGLDGKVAVVTGAGRGIGRAHALALAAQGVRVVVNDLGDGDGGTSPASGVVDQIRHAGGVAAEHVASVADWQSARGLIDMTVDRFGQLDFVVNNAGVLRMQPLGAMDAAVWQQIVSVNLIGTAAVSHWAAVHWQGQGAASGRAIVNTTSPSGMTPMPGGSAYSASKAGIAALTIAAAAELAPLGVRVNAIAPISRTRMSQSMAGMEEILKPVEQGFDRLAPEHAARLLIYLTSAACDFTGRVFAVEGDDIFLYNAWSAGTHVNSAGQPWTVEALQSALTAADRNDRPLMVMPSACYEMPQPGEATLAILRSLG